MIDFSTLSCHLKLKGTAEQATLRTINAPLTTYFDHTAYADARLYVGSDHPKNPMIMIIVLKYFNFFWRWQLFSTHSHLPSGKRSVRMTSGAHRRIWTTLTALCNSTTIEWQESIRCNLGALNRAEINRRKCFFHFVQQGHTFLSCPHVIQWSMLSAVF